MRVLILSTVRTRSSFFIDTVSKFYNLKNLYEYYGHLDFQILGNTFHKKQEVLWGKFKEKTLEKTNLLSGMDDYAIKIHPNNFINVFKYHHQQGYQGPWCMNDKDDIMPLSYLSIDSYDTIYYLTRNNFVDLYCSWIHGLARQKLLFKVEESKKINRHKTNMTIKFDKRVAKILLFDILLLDNLYIKLLNEGKKIIKLDYDETVPYANQHFDGVQSTYVDAKFDYKELVNNYDQLAIELETTKQELYKEVNWDLFSK